MNINQIFFNRYWWTNSKPRIEPISYYSELMVAILAIILAIAIIYIYKGKSETQKKYLAKWSKLIGYCAFSLLVVLFSRWQTLPVLGSHSAEGLTIGIFIAGAIYLCFNGMFKYPKQIAKEYREQTIEKYLPKPKGE